MITDRRKKYSKFTPYQCQC